MHDTSFQIDSYLMGYFSSLKIHKTSLVELNGFIVISWPTYFK